MQWLSGDAYVPVDDRGLNYGDGVFETLRTVNASIPFLDRHMLRLNAGLRRLGIEDVDCDVVARRLTRAALAIDSPHGWLKLTVTRGSGPRGYASSSASESRVIFTSGRFEPNETRPTVQWCDTVLPTDPLLGGLKHLNRLPQVMAARELMSGHEGLMSNVQGEVVCGIMHNVFIVTDNQLLTPPVHNSGVAGVMRGWVLDNAANVTETALSRADIAQADEVILTNAIRGIRSAAFVDAQELPMQTPVADHLRGALARAWSV